MANDTATRGDERRYPISVAAVGGAASDRLLFCQCLPGLVLSLVLAGPPARLSSVRGLFGAPGSSFLRHIPFVFLVLHLQRQVSPNRLGQAVTVQHVGLPENATAVAAVTSRQHSQESCPLDGLSGEGVAWNRSARGAT